MTKQISPELETYSPEVFETSNGEMLAVRFDVTNLLESKVGPEWQKQSCDAILNQGMSAVKHDYHPTLREPAGKFSLITLEGDKFYRAVPGMWELYQGAFKQMMQAALPAGLEPLHSYDNPIHGLEAVAQPTANPGSDVQNRYEAHVDQRYTAVLILDAPNNSAYQGGRLVIANNTHASSIEEINQGATYIEHIPGTLVCFSSGRFFPHYTEEVTDPNAKRVTISLNYPVEGETPEEAQAMLDYNLGKK